MNASAAKRILAIVSSSYGEEWHDMTIVIDGQEFKVMKYFLARESAVWKSMFYGKFIEAQTDLHEIKFEKGEQQFSAADMRNCLDFVYKGACEKLDLGVASQLLLIANKYDMPNLKTYACEYLSTQVNATAVGLVWQIAKQHSAVELLETCTKFLKNCSNKQKQELLKADSFLQTTEECVKFLATTIFASIDKPIEVYRALRVWTKNYKENDEEEEQQQHKDKEVIQQEEAKSADADADQQFNAYFLKKFEKIVPFHRFTLQELYYEVHGRDHLFTSDQLVSVMNRLLNTLEINVKYCSRNTVMSQDRKKLSVTTQGFNNAFNYNNSSSNMGACMFKNRPTTWKLQFTPSSSFSNVKVFVGFTAPIEQPQQTTWSNANANAVNSNASIVRTEQLSLLAQHGPQMYATQYNGLMSFPQFKLLSLPAGEIIDKNESISRKNSRQPQQQQANQNAFTFVNADVFASSNTFAATPDFSSTNQFAQQAIHNQGMSAAWKSNSNNDITVTCNTADGGVSVTINEKQFDKVFTDIDSSYHPLVLFDDSVLLVE